jgi:hypothetical protein
MAKPFALTIEYVMWYVADTRVIPDTGVSMCDTRYQIPDTGVSTRDTLIPDTLIPDTGVSA